MALGLGEGVGPLGGQAGLDPGWQGSGGLAGRVPVGGQLGGGRRGRAVGQLGLVGERLGQGGVEPGPFPGQQVGVDDLAEQGVTNLVAVEVGHRDQQLAANGGL